MNNDKSKIPSSELVIVPEDWLPVLDSNPIDSTGDQYSRLERLASWFVLRSPLGDITKLASQSFIDKYRLGKDPKQGARTQNRVAFESAFLVPLGLDCTKFEFVYRRREVRGAMNELELETNSDAVFSSFEERGVLFVGKKGSVEDSCIESVCRHVRNALAHGRLAIKCKGQKPFLFLEDGASPRNVSWPEIKPEGDQLEVRMRMVLSFDTLEAWHSILEGKFNPSCNASQS